MSWKMSTSALSSEPNVHVGHDGWLFLVDGSNSVIDLYKNESSFDASLARQWVELLRQRHDRFQARGIEYVHLAAPEKLTVLHKFYSGDIENIDGSPILQLAARHAGEVPCLLNVVPYLARNIDNFPIYWKTDTHWSAWGCYLAYQQLCARLRLPTNTEILSYPHSDVDISMDLGARLNPPASENVRFYRLEKKSRRVYANPLVRYKESKGFRNEGNLHVGSNVIFRNDSSDAADKVVVLFGDSFSEYRNHLLTGMLAETVRELHFIWSSNIDDEYVRRVRPDIVISELAERFMTRVPTDDIDIDSLARERVEKHARKNAKPLENRGSFIKRKAIQEGESVPMQLPVTVQEGATSENSDSYRTSSDVELVEAHGVALYFNGERCLARAPAGEDVIRYGVDNNREQWVVSEEYRKLTGTSFLLGDSPGAHCYYHWMLDVLPKLGYLKKAGVALSSVQHFLVREITADFQIETLSRLGIPRERIVETVGDQYLDCDRLLHVPLIHGANMKMAPFVPQWLRQEFSSPETCDERIKLYISRPEGVRRGISNEADLIPLLQREGFLCRSMEGLSVLEQAQLLARTDVLISPHGGALTNMVFCNAGTTIVELLSRHVYPFYYGLANVCGHRYHAILEDPVQDYERLVSFDVSQQFASADTQARTRAESFEVDPALLEAMLQRLKDGEVGSGG